MNSILTLGHLKDLRTLFPPASPLEIRVFNFREQWRTPRTKKRRIRNKWKKAERNWRPILGRCYKVGGMLVMGPDVKAALDAEIPRMNVNVVARAEQPTDSESE
jgi:hypothetical protein